MLGRRCLRPALVLFALLTASAAFGRGMLPPVAAQAAAGTIAFARLNDQTGNEIWLIEPDGSNQRRIWSSGAPVPSEIDQFIDLDWRPDAGELAFASNHEQFGDATCSLFELGPLWHSARRQRLPAHQQRTGLRRPGRIS